MSTRVNEKIGEESFDNLVNQCNPPADVFTVVLRAGLGIVVRGTALAKSSGTAGKSDMVILGTAAITNETLTANCILAEDVDTGSSAGATLTGLAYRTGHFNGNMLVVKSGYTISATDKEELRKGGILLDDAQKI